MEKLAEIAAQLISSGLHPSLPNAAVPFWEAGENVIFQELSVRPQPGQFLLFSKAELSAGLGAVEAQIADVPNLFWGTRQNLYRGIKGTPAPTQVTRAGGGYTGTNSNNWSIDSFGNLVLATQGVDVPQYWSLGSPANFVDLDTVSDLPDTFRCEIVITWGPFMLAMNTDNDDQEVRWCDEDDLTTWIPTPANKARDILIRDLNSPILAAQPLGNGIGIYGRNQLRLLSFVGPPFFFADNPLLEGIGVFGKGCVASVGRRHFGFGPRGIFVTDGASFEYLDSPSIHDYIFNQLDKELASRSVLWHDAEDKMVYLSFPTGDGVGTTVGFNYKAGQFSIHNLYRSAASSGIVFDFPITINADGDVWLTGASEVSTGEPIPIQLTEFFFLRAGYGALGYGELGYGHRYFVGPAEATPPQETISIILTREDGSQLNFSQSLDTASAYVRSKALDFGHINMTKFIDQILLEIENLGAAANLKLNIYHALREEDTFVLAQSINLASGSRLNPNLPEAGYFKFEFEDTTILTRWALSRMVIFGAVTSAEN